MAVDTSLSRTFLLGSMPACFQPEQNLFVGTSQFSIGSVFNRFDQNATTVYVHHNHNVFVIQDWGLVRN
jgi:hypothetical protein